MKKRIHRILPLLMLLALLLGMLPAGGAMRAYATETETVAAETEGSTEVPAVTEESTSEPEAEETQATDPETGPEPDTLEKEESEESEPLDETEQTDAAEPFQEDKPARDPTTGYGRPTGTIEELEAIPIPDEILADSYGLQIPVILYGTTTFRVSFKYPNDPQQTSYSVGLSGFRYHYLNGQMAYCLEPQAGSTAGAVYSQIAGGAELNVWERFLSIGQRNAIALALAYGAPNGLNSSTKLTLHGYEAATQVIIWELIIGYRNTSAPFACTNSGLYNFVLSLCNPNDSTGTLRAAYISGYNSIVSCMQSHGVIPSFASKKQAQAQEHEMAYDAASGLYRIVLTDSNNAINNDFPYTSGNGLTFTKSGNRLTVTATAEALRNQPVMVSATGNDPDTDNVSPVIWGTTNSNHNVGQILSQLAKPDPVHVYFKLKGPTTTALTIQKNSDDGNVANISFTVKNSAGSMIFTGKTGSDGRLTVPDLLVGDTVTVTETVPADYVADNRTQTITLAAGNNVLTFVNHPIAYLEIVKESTDGNVANITFTVKNSAGAEIYTGTTDSNGKLNVEGLTVGEAITVTETVPDHYVAENRTQTITLVKGLNTVRFRNFPTGDGTMQKTAEDGAVEGYYFRLYRHKDNTAGISGKTWCGKSDAEGNIYLTDEEFNYLPGEKNFTFSDLTDGKYSLRELLSLYGVGDVQAESITIQTTGGVTEACNLVFSGDDIHMDENGDSYITAVPLTGLTGGGHLTITVHNKPILTPGSLTVKKVDPQMRPLSGVTFLLEYSTDNGTTWAPVFHRDDESEPIPGGCTTENLAEGKLTTGVDGLAAFTGLFTNRREVIVLYRLTEVRTAPGYSLLTEPVFQGTLSKGEATDLGFTVVNSPDYEMPMTGGPGFHWIGLASALAVLSVALLWSLRRRKHSH